MYVGAAPVLLNDVARVIAVAGMTASAILLVTSIWWAVLPSSSLAGWGTVFAIAGLMAVNSNFWAQDVDWALQETRLEFPYDLKGVVLRVLLWVLWFIANIVFRRLISKINTGSAAGL